ncbi:PREDICTED: protein decapping 5-like [Lupinus angustifolius]|uniref:protein decapping 5-like n=1 Tax=Lupinus angustifolius TaxID=3871 RepID=UPI00092F9E94|nr:PREDICTED: protein decapping 5-like [Lupinus angustifolius]XP_019455653.1 PREDICTED: protein decapping 5-like [Lupinus angustifolius]
MASENASRSNSAADSYIGSLISLTSKSEIRYEGVLYNINTEESSIGLRNVRSFGTEGRKKDGQQIPPGDKVYEYILFRGSDIKDLQVKSSPPVQPTPQVSNDPAIIQSHYSRPVTTSTNLPNVVSGSLADLSSHATQLGIHGSNFQGPLPLYQPGGNIGSWGASPPAPNANGGGIAMPMYWQGYYGAPNGLPHLHQQSLLQPPGLSMPSSMQQPMQYPNFSLSLPTGSSNLPELPSSLLPVSTSAHSVTSAFLPPSDLSPVPSSLAAAPSSLPEAPSMLHPAPSALPPNVSLPAVTPAANLLSLTPLTNSGSEMNATVPPIFSKANATSGSSSTYQTVSPLLPSIVGSSNSIRSETPTPSLVTPGQLLQPGPTAVSTAHPSQTPHKDVEVVQVSSTSSPQPSLPVSAENQPPILPLPVTSRSSHRPGGAPTQTHNGYGYRGRGRGRGTGVLRPVTKFTEEFDFMAMNEKFKKDEVWGDLGKSNKSHSKEKDGEENSFDEDYIQDEDNDDSSNFKPVYNKDDFFDSLSSNALDQASQNGRIRYSEQIKIDTETFGNFARPRSGRGGRGPFHGGHPSRGGYYGRGYGYSGRGRGRGIPSRSS